MIDEDLLKNIERLHQLKNDGVITPSDFDQSKGEKLIRLGLVLSAVWLVGGGWWSYSRHSYYHNLSVMLRSESDEIIPVDWASFVTEMAAGMLILWLAVFALRWIMTPKG